MRNFVALSLAGAVSATTMKLSDYNFMRYIVQHNKEYKTLEEFTMRQSNFLFMDAEIVRLNQNSTSVHGHNFLSDWTHDEYVKLLGLKTKPNKTVS